MLFINNIKIAFRNALRNKLFSLINITGLALGLACCLLIVLFVRQELSYDNFQKNIDNIYRVGVDVKINEMELKIPSTQNPLGKVLVDEYPAVDNYTRLSKCGNEKLLKVAEKIYIISNVYRAEASFFDIFTVDFLIGNKDALKEVNSVVISKETAERCFKSVQNSIDKTINIDDVDCTVKAVIENSRYNTHIKINVLYTKDFDKVDPKYEWYSDGAITYISTKPNTDIRKLEVDIQGVVNKYILPRCLDMLNIEVVAPNYYRYYLMPMRDIHLHSHSIAEFEENGNSTYVNMFIIIAIFILLIACINFSNLSTAKASTRAREIGIKKALGSDRKRIMYQFFIESIIISLIAFIFALVILEVSLPIVNKIIGLNIQVDIYSDLGLLFIFIGIAILTGLIAGSYSAIYLSSFKPIKILKGELTQGKKSASFRGVLVILQFAISIFLIVCTLIINKQMNFINNKDIGYKTENFIKLENADIIKNKDLFRQKLMNISGVESSTFATALPGNFFTGSMINKYNSDDKNSYSMRMVGCDDDFCKTMRCEIKEGRFFAKEFSNDSLSIVLNEAAVKELGLIKPIGTELRLVGDEKILKVVGVIKNFHTVSLKTKVNSLMISQGELAFMRLENIGIRLSDGSQANTLRQIEKVWNEYTDNTPIEYTYFDNIIEKLNRKENNNLKVFTGFSILAIFIACIGLLGLISFTIDQKIKEIGIRKINGASVSSIMLNLNKNVVKWISISFIIACPFAYWLMNNWLQDFIYKIDIDPWIFIISGVLTFLIGVLTVSWQVFRVSRMNPVYCLKYE
ncbi:MAG: FtsX-like permease family protein [Marinifilaceae bacterium]